MGTVTILSETTKNPLALMGQVAGICYASDTENEEKNRKRGIGCLESGHHRVAEFPHVWMVIDGYSARVMREYMRHVGDGLTCLQASTRYIDYADKGFDYIVPHSANQSSLSRELYDSVMEDIRVKSYSLEELGVPKEDVANLLPLGMETKLVDCKNLRVLMDMSHTRMCTTAYWEFRELFRDISNALSDYSEEWKYIVDNYFKRKCELCGYCNEGKRSCGLYPTKEEYDAQYEEFLSNWRKNKT